MSVGPGWGSTLGCPYYQRPGDAQLAPRTWILLGLVAWPAWSSQACRGRSAPPPGGVRFWEAPGVGACVTFVKGSSYLSLKAFFESFCQQSSRVKLCDDNCRPQSPVSDDSPLGLLKSPVPQLPASIWNSPSLGALMPMLNSVCSNRAERPDCWVSLV